MADEQKAPPAAVTNHPRWDRFRNEGLEGVLYRLVSRNEFDVPLDHESITVDDDGVERVFCFLNDSFEIGIGYPSEWHAIIRRPAIHRFMRWYIRRWAWGEWFGLRRWIFYGLLSRRVARNRALFKAQ